MRVLFLLPYSREAASVRYRIHQFVPFLEQNGIDCDLRELVDPELYSILYAPGHRARKAALFARRTLTRIRDVLDARDHDVLFIHRETFPFGPAFIETYLRSLGKPIVFDFDDAIYLLPDGGPLKALLRMPQKTGTIVRLADEVIVSNEHLRGYSAAYNKRVTIIPTSIDTDVFRPRAYPSPGEWPSEARPLRLGWIGSSSTAKYLMRLAPALARVASRVPAELLVVGAGRPLDIPGIRLVERPWRLDTEVEDFRSLDVGVYPLDDDVWELGKGGFKTTQLMSVAVPAVVSPVGVNCTMVREGENGFFAATEDEWVAKLCALADPDLRRRVGMAGRRTAEESLSLAVNAPNCSRCSSARPAAAPLEPTLPSHGARHTGQTCEESMNKVSPGSVCRTAMPAQSEPDGREPSYGKSRRAGEASANASAPAR